MTDSLDKVTSGFRSGIITKDDYEGALRAHYSRQLEMKSEARDKAIPLRCNYLQDVPKMYIIAEESLESERGMSAHRFTLILSREGERSSMIWHELEI